VYAPHDYHIPKEYRRFYFWFKKAMSLTNRQEKFAHVEAWEQSGLSISQYARDNGLSKDSLRYWISRKRDNEIIENGAPGFLEISSMVEQPEMFSAVNPNHSPKAVMRFPGGLTLEIY